MKVPVLTTLLSDNEGSHQGLSDIDRANASRALEQSDNAAAEALFAHLERVHGGLIGGSRALQRTLAAAGDARTLINTLPNSQGFTTWGQSIWSNAGEVKFYRALAGGCLLAPADTSYVLGLMRRVVPDQRWGAGDVGYPPGVPLALKGGWGPEPSGGYLVRQTVVVGLNDRGYVMSVLALPSSGSFSDGVSLISAIARWAKHTVRVVRRPPDVCRHGRA